MLGLYHTHLTSILSSSILIKKVQPNLNLLVKLGSVSPQKFSNFLSVSGLYQKSGFGHDYNDNSTFVRWKLYNRFTFHRAAALLHKERAIK